VEEEKVPIPDPNSSMKLVAFPIYDIIPQTLLMVLLPDCIKHLDYAVSLFNYQFIGKFGTTLLECRLVDDVDLEVGNFRLFETSPHLILPRSLQITLLVTSNDVLHSWAVPSLGIKIDACPGRLNEVQFLLYKEGLFFGQCSEICGFYHGFMPIVVNSTDVESFFRASDCNFIIYD